jgi:hypothetical protein
MRWAMNRLQIYRYVVFPLALRVSLPALNNNLVNLVKTTTQAIAIAVPELLYQLVSIYNDYPPRRMPAWCCVGRLHRAGRPSGHGHAQVGAPHAHSGLRECNDMTRRRTAIPGLDPLRTDLPS